MSASREKKTRQDPSGQGLSEKKLKQQQEGRQTHVHHIVYTVLAVLVVLFGVGLPVILAVLFIAGLTAFAVPLLILALLGVFLLPLFGI